MLCLVGSQGAGKSTFSRCFCGLEKQCGTIIWNGKTYRPKERLKACYMVMQEVNHQLFTETIQDEVMISMKEENEKEADKFLDMLDLIKVKDRHPMSLSGGQKQRMAIARAIVKKPEILIFDDSTSALDLSTEAKLHKALRENLSGVTVIMIAQRIASVMRADKIAVLENGSICAFGTHKELMEASDVYRDIYYSQMKQGEGETVNG